MKQQSALEVFKTVMEYAYEVVHEMLVFVGRILDGQSISSDVDNMSRRKHFDEEYYRKVSGYYKDKD